jgi:hypothetical protein
MHTKIITQQNDPNFLTHVIWLKTNLVVQHIHLELLWNLSCAILKKNKHNSRIIISGIYKIVNNSPEVCFGIKRQCAKVGCKNLNTFWLEKSFIQIRKKWKNIFRKRFT